MRFIAIDWSGRETGAAEYIWVAEARGGELAFLESGRDRAAAIGWLIDAARADPPIVVGLDFSFSLPAWYCAQQGWHSGPEVWQAMRDRGDALLAAERPPFWGRRAGRPAQLTPERERRVTEREDAPGAKSTFQIGGAGAVGTGSVRGMALLPQLAAGGFAIWPFMPPRRCTALEIYPRGCYPAGGRRVVKRSWSARRELLGEWYPDHPAPLLERAAGSEDAFDAAVSALEMERHAPQLTALADLSGDPVWALEGRAWVPPREG